MQRLGKLALFCFALLLLSCSKDAIAPVLEGPPTISLSSSSAVAREVKPLEVFGSILTITRGKNKIKGITILENNQLIDAARFTIGSKAALGNPTIFNSPLDEGGSIRIDITAPTSIGNNTYKFILTDYLGDTASTMRVVSINAKGPTIKYNGPIINIATISAPFKYKLSGKKEQGKLTTLQVLEDDKPIAANRLNFGGKAAISNPIVLELTESALFDKDLQITSPSASGTYTYKFILTDEFGASSADSTRSLVGIPLKELVSKNLYNASRGGSNGGIDLNTGVSTTTISVNADIADSGIDTTILDKTLNWVRQIYGVNGTEIRQIINGKNGVPLVYSYTQTYIQEELVSLFLKGEPFTSRNKQGTLISERVQVGQNFIAKRGNLYYLIEVAGIINTADDNEDYYRLNIKQ